MKLFVALFSMLLCSACFGGDHHEVTLVYFNLSTNEIWITDIQGLPKWAPPGFLNPVLHEDQLSEKSMTSRGKIHIPATFTIVWREGQSLTSAPFPEMVKGGAKHEVKLEREDLGLSPTESGGRIMFSYLGNDKWRIKRIH